MCYQSGWARILMPKNSNYLYCPFRIKSTSNNDVLRIYKNIALSYLQKWVLNHLSREKSNQSESSITEANGTHRVPLCNAPTKKYLLPKTYWWHIHDIDQKDFKLYKLTHSI